MLDFYTSETPELTCEYPNENDYLGGVEIDEFEEFKSLCESIPEIHSKLNYHSDFSLSKAEVIELKLLLDNREEVPENMHIYLAQAEVSNKGLMAYAD